MFLKYLYTAARERGDHRHMFEDVATNGMPEDEKLRLARLNDAINDDPVMKLPKGFKKVMENNVSFSYDIAFRLPVSERFKICYNIINDILRDTFE